MLERSNSARITVVVAHVGRLNDGTIPSHCKVAIIVLPASLPISECRTSPLDRPRFDTDPLHEPRGTLGALVVVDLQPTMPGSRRHDR